MTFSPQPLLILYASQTGNAQDVAELIAREAERRYFQSRVLPADAYLHTSLAQFPSEPATIFVVSTTGQGDPPENIIDFWKFLRRKSLPPNSLSSMAVAVFGLGDSGYLKYNTMGKLLYRRLEALGARALVPLGLGDDQHKSGYDAELDVWLPRLWKALRSKFPLPTAESFPEPAPEDTSGILKPKYTVTMLPNFQPPPLDNLEELKGYGNSTSKKYEAAVAAAAAIEKLDAIISGLPPSSSSTTSSSTTGRYSAAHPVFATLEKNTRVTAESHFQDVRLLDFQFSNPTTENETKNIEFDPGDIIAVWPQQREDSIRRFCTLCDLDPEAWVSIRPPLEKQNNENENNTRDGNSGIHNDITILQIGSLIAGVLDIDSAIPRRSFFQALAQHCPPGLHADRLHYFASAQGRDDLHEYCRREGRTILEILTDFSTAKLSLEWLLSYCPRLRPRRFSVASSLALLPNKAQLLVAVAEWTTPVGRRRRKGLCSSWLAGLKPGAARVAMWVERGALKFPKIEAQSPALPAPPVILIGPGTGVAPFRSFLQHRLYYKKQENGLQVALNSAENGGDNNLTSNITKNSSCVLVFGCRNEYGDYYCRQDWEDMQSAGVLVGPPNNGLLTAFSRDTDKKVYVQHRIKEHGKEIWDLLQRGAAVFVAGSADKMPVEVEAAFKSVVAEHGEMEWAEAEKYVKRMEATGRYQVECWS
jgi:sulfite reductase alpha subunit-like flavoprotein